MYKTYIYMNGMSVPSIHCNTDIDLEDGENRSWGSNGENGLFANSGDRDRPPKLVGVPGLTPGWPTGNWKCVPFVEYLGLSISGLNEFQNVKALAGIIPGVVLPKKGEANVTIGVCSDCANAWLNRVGLVGIPVIGGGLGLNLVEFKGCDDFPFDRVNGWTAVRWGRAFGWGRRWCSRPVRRRWRSSMTAEERGLKVFRSFVIMGRTV